jgi:hypothetical protein
VSGIFRFLAYGSIATRVGFLHENDMEKGGSLSYIKTLSMGA